MKVKVQQTPVSLVGRLLLAMPDMPDPRFARAVILLCIHDDGGALGIALGDPVEGLGLHELLQSFDVEPGPVEDVPVLAGGPMEPRRGFVLHGTDWTTADSIEVGHNIALTASLDVLRAIALGQGPKDYLVALGYAGWGRGQIEKELSSPGWFLSDVNARDLFAYPAAERWAAAFSLEGIDPNMLAYGSGEA